MSPDAFEQILDEKIGKIQQLIAGLQTDIHAGPQRWLNVAEAAVYASVSERSIRGMFSSGRLTAHRPVKGRVLVDREQLDAVIESSIGNVRKGRGLTRGSRH